MHSTFEERKETLLNLFDDKEVHLSSMEVVKYLYNFFGFEIAYIRRGVAQRAMARHAKRLTGDLDVYSLRKEMVDL